MLPAVRAGAAKAGRSLEQFQVCMKPLVATAATEEELAPKVVDVRARISFYASTPQYRAAFAHHGLGDLADELKLLSRAQRWEEMPQHITDDVLHTFVTIGTYDQIAAQASRPLSAAWSRIASSRSRSIARPTRTACATWRGRSRARASTGPARRSSARSADLQVRLRAFTCALDHDADLEVRAPARQAARRSRKSSISSCRPIRTRRLRPEAERSSSRVKRLPTRWKT